MAHEWGNGGAVAVKDDFCERDGLSLAVTPSSRKAAGRDYRIAAPLAL
jgi:hypothetical protein